MKHYQDTVTRCRRFCRDGQMRFYEQFHRSVFNSSYRILNDALQAEEVMQETLLKVLMKPDMLRSDPGEMEALLRRIAINHSIDLCRRRKIELVEFDSVLENKTEERSDNDVSANGITVESVKRKMTVLPRGCRLILELVLLEGLDYEEIAQLLSVAPSAVRSQYSRARRKLSDLLKQDMTA